MRIERDVDGGSFRGVASGRERARVGWGEAGAGPDRSAAFPAGLRERLQSQILAIEHRGRGGGEDDPQARRWLDRARHVRRQESDEAGMPPERVRAHSLQEKDPEHPPAPGRADREDVRPSLQACLRTGWREIDTTLGGWPLGTIHELFGIEWDGPVRGVGGPSPSSSPPRWSPWIPPMGVTIRLASAALRGIGGGVRSGSDPGLPRRGVLWVGRAIRPDPGALGLLGDARDSDDGKCPDTDLLTRSFFLDAAGDPLEHPEAARPSARARAQAGTAAVRMPIRTWAIEQAIRHEAFAVVVADARGMTLAESRRLQVAASGRNLPMLILLLREPCEATLRSVAGFRWRVEPCSGEHVGDPADRGQPATAWRLRLMRGRASLPPEVRRMIESDAGLGVRIEVRPEDQHPASDWFRSGSSTERSGNCWGFESPCVSHRPELRPELRPEWSLADRVDREPMASSPSRARRDPFDTIPSAPSAPSAPLAPLAPLAWSTRSCTG